MNNKTVTTKRPIERVAVIVTVVSFFGSTAFGAIQMVNSALHQPQENTDVAASIIESPAQQQASQLQLQEKEYEVVLKQEPNNQVALQGLVEVRLEMKNYQGAIAPLNQLVKIHPAQQKYKTLLAQIKQQVGKSDR